MSDMTDDDEFWGPIEDPEPVRVRKIDLVWTVATLVADISEAFTDAFRDVANLVGGQVNYVRAQDDFARNAGLEIERITEGES